MRICVRCPRPQNAMYPVSPQQAIAWKAAYLARNNMDKNMNESSMLKRSIYFIPRAVLRDVSLLVLILAFVTGCASLDVAPKSATAKADDAILTFVESAPTAGRTGQVEISGKAALIRVERLYESASGQACRRYHLSPSKGVPTSGSYLACRGADDHWFLSRLLLNPDLLTGPQSSASHRASKP